MPTPNKREVLESLSFGQQVAEEEAKELANYFVETEQWRGISSGAVDIVYGPKGAGKSALYALLLDRYDDFLERSILVVSGENPRGATVFHDLVTDPPTSEREFIQLWKLYFLVLVAEVLREYISGHESTKKLISALREANLLHSDTKLSLQKILKTVYDYIRRGPESVEGDVKIDPASGLPIGVGGKIKFREPSAAESSSGVISVGELFTLAEEALASTPLTVWILMDRLDVAFADSPELEANALRALFKAYLDLLGAEHIRLKIFLRTDIWRRITRDQGFREASHITRNATILWDKASLTNLVVRRVAQSQRLMEYCGLSLGGEIDHDSQVKLFDVLFPDQVEVGPNKPKTSFDWILGRTSDGTGQNAPRELIHFLNVTRASELSKLDLGNGDEGEKIFSRSAIKNALPEVSTVRLERTLFAEYPDIRSYIIGLEEEKTLQRPDTLASIWHIEETRAAAIAEQLVEVGFFEKRGTKEAPEFWVPFLYRPALKMVQGSAE